MDYFPGRLGLLALAALPLQATASVAAGTVAVPGNSATILTKFCFDFDPDPAKHAGVWKLTFHRLTTKPAESSVWILLFDDEVESFPEISGVWDEASCEEKMKHAKWKREVSSEARSPQGWQMDVPLSQKVRPRWWFAALASCSPSAVEFEYVIHPTNPLRGWQKEYSMDRTGIFYISLGFLVLFGLCSVLQFAAYKLWRAEGYEVHPLIRGLTACVWAAVLAELIGSLHYGMFAENGTGSRVLFITSRALSLSSKCLFMLLLLLMSRGWCISHSEDVAEAPQVKVAVGIFWLVSVVLEIWGEYSSSSAARTVYVYDTWPGIVLVTADLGWLWFYMSALAESYKAEVKPDKKRFYATWGLGLGLWFLALPVSTFMGTVFDPWVRYKAVYVTVDGLHFAFVMTMIHALWPSNAHKLFTMEHSELVDVDDLDGL
mmetsp:Transcript_118617/g.272158  ORF Transcript_118617/g.272158 Transcript_118617/m.272158 type:complete len:432 (+) Transcript_118617:23-1318(+)